MLTCLIKVEEQTEGREDGRGVSHWLKKKKKVTRVAAVRSLGWEGASRSLKPLIIP